MRAGVIMRQPFPSYFQHVGILQRCDDLQRLHAWQDHRKANKIFAEFHSRFRKDAIHIAGCPTATPARLAFLGGSEGYLVGWGVEGVSKTRLSDAMSSSEHAVTVPKKESGMACR